MKKFALVTGASGGIGQAISFKLAEAGYSLYLHYHQNEVEIQKLYTKLQQFQGDFIPIKADLSSKNGYLDLLSNIFTIDAIVHNAGNALYGVVEEVQEESLEELIRIHNTSPFLITKSLLPKMRQRGKGSIVMISSIWGQTGSSGEVAYSMVKGAQISFAKALSKEVAPSGIRVNVIAPGAILTPMLSNFESAEMTSIKEAIPLERFGNPAEVADCVEFLFSERSSYMTGQVLGLNGGWYA